MPLRHVRPDRKPVSFHACAVIRAIRKMRFFRYLSVHNPEYPCRLKQPGWPVPEWVWGFCSLHGLQIFVRGLLSPVLRITICIILNKKCGKATTHERVLYLPYVKLIWGNSAENRKQKRTQ